MIPIPQRRMRLIASPILSVPTPIRPVPTIPPRPTSPIGSTPQPQPLNLLPVAADNPVLDLVLLDLHELAHVLFLCGVVLGKQLRRGVLGQLEADVEFHLDGVFVEDCVGGAGLGVEELGLFLLELGKVDFGDSGVVLVSREWEG